MGGVGIVGVDFSALFDPRGGKGKIKNPSLGFQRLNSIYNLISYFDFWANTKQQDQHLLLETCGCGTQTTRRLNEWLWHSDIYGYLCSIIRGNRHIQPMCSINDH